MLEAVLLAPKLPAFAGSALELGMAARFVSAAVGDVVAAVTSFRRLIRAVDLHAVTSSKREATNKPGKFIALR